MTLSSSLNRKLIKELRNLEIIITMECSIIYILTRGFLV